MKNITTNGNKGFSLVELVIVIAVMAVLMGVIAPTLVGSIERSRESTDLQNIATVHGVVENAMSVEGVYAEVMKNAATSVVIIDLGETDDVNLDGSGLDSYLKLRNELKEMIKTDIDMKSTAALKAGNHLLVEVTKDGEISVYVANSATANSSDAISCSKTTDVDGIKKLFLISK